MTLGRYVCDARIFVFGWELELLARMRGADAETIRDVAKNGPLRCTLETHEGPHAEMVREGSAGEALWVRWEDGSRPHEVRWLPDCPKTGVAADGVDDGCCHYLNHPGGHTWEVTDPEFEMVKAIVPAVRDLRDWLGP